MNEDKIKTLATFDEPGAYPVKWEYDGTTHQITYGVQKTHFRSHLRACREYGESIRHALECSGAFNWENFS